MTTTHSATTGRKGRAARLALAAVVAAAALVGLSPATSSADIPPKVDPPPPLAVLELTLKPTGDVTSSAAGKSTVTLTCSPDGGTHPTPKAACDSLRAVDGNFPALPDTGDFCPLIFDPHTARARGVWKDRLVDYEETFSNRCFAAVGTDNVFSF